MRSGNRFLLRAFNKDSIAIVIDIIDEGGDPWIGVPGIDGGTGSL